ncbi:LysR family transcriptional regulator [Blastococcus sp. SYSU D00695]
MELQQLRYAVAVADERSFTAAAARERVAQPAVSAAIRRLERELGLQLFERGRHGARPTAAGTAVLARARETLAAAEAVRTAAGELTGLLTGRVTVGMVVGCVSEVLADLLADFARTAPAVEVVLVEGTSADLLGGLADGTLDLAWVGRADAPPPGVTTAVLYEEDQVAVVAPGDPRSRDPLPVAELAARRLVALPRGTGGRTALEAACARVGTTPTVALEATGLEMVLRLAARGLGTGVVPASVAAAATVDVRVLAIEPPVRSRIELAWRAGGPPSPAGRELVRVARDHVARARDGRSDP